MTEVRFDPDRLAELEEQRDFLVRSLADLDSEFAAGGIDPDEYRALRDDYVSRTAEVLRSLVEDRQVSPPIEFDGRTRWLITMLVVLIVASVAGVVLSQTFGQRRPQDGITGDIDRSVRSQIFEARALFGAGDSDEALKVAGEILAEDPDHVDALLLSAQINSQQGEVLLALQQVDQILVGDPDHIDGLTLRGWVLVNIDNPELVAAGISALDRAIAQDPVSPDPWIFRGFVARTIEEDLPAAIGFYEVALERDPPLGMVPQLEGLIDEMNGELESSG